VLSRSRIEDGPDCDSDDEGVARLANGLRTPCGADGRLYWGVDGLGIPEIKTFLSESDREMTPINFWSHEFAGPQMLRTRKISFIKARRLATSLSSIVIKITHLHEGSPCEEEPWVHHREATWSDNAHPSPHLRRA